MSGYFNRLKKLWDELGCLAPAPSSNAAKEITELYKRDHLMQFLMGLNEFFEGIRNQILIMEPLPSISKAYAIVLRVERQREVNSTYENPTQNMAMQARISVGGNAKNQWKRRGTQDKRNQFCTHCSKTGHSRDCCSEIHGYPEWYKTLIDQRKKGISTNNRALSMIEGPGTDKESVQNAVDDQAIA
ncbi:UNVERIFIED_CONTAM: hypothetical protein Slati_1358800 [Sesamum latifolium]|uniref:Uncharacterized protein n=1 Tax=Sesamum latifolium TaxID=2727402 RepID=A0AAW2XHY4_9LAMI